jgi:ABC-type amino acid transport substrate-binding protein
MLGISIVLIQFQANDLDFCAVLKSSGHPVQEEGIFEDFLMRLRQLLQLILALGLLPLMDTGWAARRKADDKTLHIAGPNWTNYFEPGEKGVAYEILNEIYAQENIKIIFDEMPYLRALKEVESGHADVMLDGFRRYKPDKFDYPRLPNNISVLFALFKANCAQPWQGRESLRGKNVVWIRGFQLDLVLDVPVKIMEVSTYEQAFKLVKSERVDFYLDTEPTIKTQMKLLKLNEKDFCLKRIFNIPLFLRFHKGDKARRMIEIYDRNMEKMYRSGRLKELFARWPEYDQSYPEVAIEIQKALRR